MKPRMFAALILLGASAMAQTNAPKAKKDQPKTAAKAPIPVYEIALSEDGDYQPLPWPKEWRVDFIESDCIGDRNLYVAKPESDLSLTDSGLIGLTPKGIVSFLADKITDIPNPNTDSFALHPAISASGVSFRVSGIDDAKVETTTWTDDEGHDHITSETKSAILNYIARFGKDGTYKGAIQVDGLPFEINESAAFDSGNLIAQGIDQNEAPRVALLDASAQFLRYLDLGKDITIEPPWLEESPMAVFRNRTFMPWQGKMLMFRPLTSNPRIYEIQEGGEARVVKIKAPEGYDIGSLVPTDRNWLVWVNKPDAKGGRPNDFFNALLEVDPQNGEPLREYRMKPPDKLPETVVSCFFDGEFWGLRQDVKEEKLNVVRGTAALYRGK